MDYTFLRLLGCYLWLTIAAWMIAQGTYTILSASHNENDGFGRECRRAGIFAVGLSSFVGAVVALVRVTS